MTDPFAMGLEALFSAPGSMAAIYTPLNGSPVAVRVIRTTQRADIAFGDTTVPVAAAVFEFARTAVADPMAGDQLEIAGEFFIVEGEPQLDVEGLTWRCEAPPAG